MRSICHRFESQLPRCHVQPGQVVNTHVPLSPSNMIWYQPTGGDACGRVSKCRSGDITDISGSPHTGSRPGRGRGAPAYAVLRSMVDFTFTLPYLKVLPCADSRVVRIDPLRFPA